MNNTKKQLKDEELEELWTRMCECLNALVCDFINV